MAIRGSSCGAWRLGSGVTDSLNRVTTAGVQRRSLPGSDTSRPSRQSSTAGKMARMPKPGTMSRTGSGYPRFYSFVNARRPRSAGEPQTIYSRAAWSYTWESRGAGGGCPRLLIHCSQAPLRPFGVTRSRGRDWVPPAIAGRGGRWQLCPADDRSPWPGRGILCGERHPAMKGHGKWSKNAPSC